MPTSLYVPAVLSFTSSTATKMILPLLGNGHDVPAVRSEPSAVELLPVCRRYSLERRMPSSVPPCRQSLLIRPMPATWLPRVLGSKLKQLMESDD